MLVALGFDTDGRKHVLGMREGSTENTRVVRSLISDLIERGLDADTPRLWIIDGGKALRRAITEVFGASALVQRCQEHKRRNVLDHLPEHLQASVGRAMKDAWQVAGSTICSTLCTSSATALCYLPLPWNLVSGDTIN